VLLRRRERLGRWHGLRGGPLRRSLPGEVLAGTGVGGETGSIEAGVNADAVFDALIGRIAALTAGADLAYSQGTAWTTFFDDYAAVLGASFEGILTGTDDIAGNVELTTSIAVGLMAVVPSIEAELAVSFALTLVAAISEGVAVDLAASGSAAKSASLNQDVVARALFQTIGTLTDVFGGDVEAGAAFGAALGAALAGDVELGLSVATGQDRVGVLTDELAMALAFSPLAARRAPLDVGVGVGATFSWEVLYPGPAGENIAYVIPRNWIVEL
jgi:hypothetical protein